MAAVLVVGRREIPVVTSDVSRGGLQLLTDQPPPEKRLVQVRIVLAPDTTPTVLAAVTVRTNPPGEGRRPGVAVQLYGNPAQVVAKWERFVATVPAQEGDRHSPVHAQATPLPIEPTRRRFERVAAVFEVRTASVDDLLPFASRDVSKGGMFLTADSPRAVGDVIGVELVHPERDERFEVRCVVRRVVSEAALGVGMGVEFLDLDEDRRDALWEFINGAIPDLDDDALVMLDEEFAQLELEIELELV
jgi:hypothetical protein